MNARLLINISPDNADILQRQFNDNVRAFHTKEKVWRSKLQPWLELDKVGFIMYIKLMLQVQKPVKTFFNIIKQDNFHGIEIAIQLEAALQTE